MAAHPMSVVVASDDIEVARRVQTAMNSQRFRIYISDDVRDTPGDTERGGMGTETESARERGRKRTQRERVCVCVCVCDDDGRRDGE